MAFHISEGCNTSPKGEKKLLQRLKEFITDF